MFWVLRDGEKLCIGRRYRKMKRCSCIIQTPFSHSPLPSQVTTSFDDTCRCSCGFSPADLSFGLTVKFYTPPAREGERGRDSPTLDDCLLATRYACKFSRLLSNGNILFVLSSCFVEHKSSSRFFLWFGK